MLHRFHTFTRKRCYLFWKVIKKALKQAHCGTGREGEISCRKPGVTVSGSGLVLCFTRAKPVCLAQRGCFRIKETVTNAILRFTVLRMTPRIRHGAPLWARNVHCRSVHRARTCRVGCIRGGVQGYTGCTQGMYTCLPLFYSFSWLRTDLFNRLRSFTPFLHRFYTVYTVTALTPH